MNDAQGYARQYIYQWCGRLGIERPIVKFRKMRYYGSCDFTDHIITINKLILHNRAELEDTCIHESIHLCNATHNRRFFERAKQLGLYRTESWEEFHARCK